MDASLHAQADKIIFTVLGAYFAIILVVVFWQAFKARSEYSSDLRNMASAWRATKSDFARLIAAFRRRRQSGLGVEDALTAATDEMAGKKLVVAREPTPEAKHPGGFLGLAAAILVNSVSVLGVFQFHWPIGTALALYWTENVLTGLVVVGTIALWRARQPGIEDRQRTKSPGEVSVITIVFNAAHLAFLIAFLGVMLPRIAPLERFERRSFMQGLALIAILLALDFLLAVARMRKTSAAQVERSVSLYLQRVVVLHLTIIAGMLALALFGQPRAFFAVFAGLKMIVDVTRRL